MERKARTRKGGKEQQTKWEEAERKEVGPGQRLIKAVKNCEKLLKRFSQGSRRKGGG